MITIWFIRGKQTKKEILPYPICSVVAVFKMLIRILNSLRSRIWDRAVFLFSVLWLQMKISIFVWEKYGFSPKVYGFIKMNISRRGYFLTRAYKNYIYLLLLYGEFFLFFSKTIQLLKQNFMLNCKKTMIKKKEWL